jgi:hypothetical protein
LEEGGGDKENVIEIFGAVQELFRGGTRIYATTPENNEHFECCDAIFTLSNQRQLQGKLVALNKTKGL